MKNDLTGTYMGNVYRIEVECYPKTAEIKVTLTPVTGASTIAITQNIGQSMPPYRAYLNNGLLDVCNSEFMDFMEKNGLGHIVDYKRYDFDVFTGQPRKIAADFQFDKAALQRLDPRGCARYERRYFKLNRKLERRQASCMIGASV